MKNIGISLLLALAISTPAYAVSWKDKLFAQLDTDHNGEVTYGELTAGGCPTDPKLFKYADKDRNGALTKVEYFSSRDVLGRCTL